jgi:hypothetical protein
MSSLHNKWNLRTHLRGLRVAIDPKMSAPSTEGDGGAC